MIYHKSTGYLPINPLPRLLSAKALIFSFIILRGFHQAILDGMPGPVSNGKTTI